MFKKLAGFINKSRFAVVFYLIALSVLLFTATRMALLLTRLQLFDWSYKSVLGVFTIGFVYDVIIACFLLVPLIWHLWFLNNTMYRQKEKWWAIVFFMVLISIAAFTNLVVPRDFDKKLHWAVAGFFLLRFLLYLFLLYTTPAIKNNWRKVILVTDVVIIVFLLLFNAISEWFFWDEFTTRYNFIAVDYLVYTNEVVGNIKESYPVFWIVAAVLAITVFVVWRLRKGIHYSLQSTQSFKSRSLVAVALFALPVAGSWLIGSNLRRFSNNEVTNELAGNGIYEFALAFQSNELEYEKFYQTLPLQEAFSILRNQLTDSVSHFVSDDVFNIERTVNYAAEEKKLNVVMISVESLSADFMAAFGGTENITPNLDSLAKESMFFRSMYSSGTRTVRGLEALSLSLPPSPGQSIVKRPHNENLFSLGSVFKTKGYATYYMYGGYGYFDNMSYFFGNNGYTVIDRAALPDSQIHYANIWGVADEDLFTLAINNIDAVNKKKQPFFAHIMTVSNHRPYTYPAGRIDIPPSEQRRGGAVKYTDYAIGKFIREAKNTTWFKNTVFVIIADHCASTSGKVKLPVPSYHIPCIIYAPGIIKPQEYNRLTAQMDIAPTILGLLKIDYNSKFLGQDIFVRDTTQEKAFVSTYQGLGYIANQKMVVLSPVRKAEMLLPDFTTGQTTIIAMDSALHKKAIAFYQCADWMVRHNKYTSK